MAKTFVGPQLRQLRRERKLTQAEMAKALGISPGYVNLLENNQRSLSVRLLIALADTYQVDWRDIVHDETSNLLAEHFLELYDLHRTTLERIMRQGERGAPEGLLATSAEAVIHDFFRNHSNYFHRLEIAAEQLRAAEPCEADDIYAVLKARLFNRHGIRVRRRAVEEMTQALRVYDRNE